MKKITIITDSASDITLRQLADWDVRLVSMPILFGDDTILDDKTREMSVFWNFMKEGGILKTSLPSPDVFAEAFAAEVKAGRAVVCITIGSALSGTYQSAVLARSMAGGEDIYVIDSWSASSGEKLLVQEACRLRAQGLSAREIAERIEERKKDVRLFAGIDTLEYLVKGGRLSSVAGQIGSMINLKPIITLREQGKIEVAKKSIGIKRAIHDVAKLVEENPMDTECPVLGLFACEDENLKSFRAYFAAHSGFEKEMPADEIGATIGAYIGPGGFGLAYFAKKSTD